MRKSAVGMPTSAAQLEHVADDLKSWVRRLADDAEESQWIRLSDAQVPCTHPSFPCASLHIPRLSVSQCVFVAFCRARGLNPTKTTVYAATAAAAWQNQSVGVLQPWAAPAGQPAGGMQLAVLAPQLPAPATSKREAGSGNGATV